MSNSDNASERVTRAPVSRDDCGMARAAELLGDAWGLLILRELFYGVNRFADLQADLGVSSATLTVRINRLVEGGLLLKVPYRDGSARTRFEYQLTPAGAALAPVMMTMLKWADTCLDKPSSPVQLTHRTSGKALHLALVDEDGNEVPWQQAALEVRPPGVGR